jgi:hypothetical protein
MMHKLSTAFLMRKPRKKSSEQVLLRLDWCDTDQG